MSEVLPQGSKILFLSSVPGDQPRIDTNEEYRMIDEAVRNHFQLRARLAARPEDMIFSLAEEKPRVLHFSGHGEGAKGLVFQKDGGKSARFSAKALKALLGEESLTASVSLAVLSACTSVAQAKAFARRGLDVVAMQWEVLDEVAREFAGAFYRLLCNLAPEKAFGAALAVLKGRGIKEADTPMFLKGRKGARVDAASSGSRTAPPQREPDRTALREFLARDFPESSLSNVEFDVPRYFKEYGETLKLKSRGERARALISWVEQHGQMPLLIAKLESAEPELLERHAAKLFGTPLN